ncbi:hypothetical protein SAZ10_28850 [Mesorhizobium sp. BAC0120]|uniref:hypothetical protein n=1 Tax=Mesorhizobium sp. BAC0120 TaxID=3090670 RepID=UPI00298C8197|nr:hypothetical protein [Mesorhizobium sp. BAC0120]MDW6025779.1 hypothetical protein [Mesorhizobium sp. BAC0120]
MTSCRVPFPYLFPLLAGLASASSCSVESREDTTVAAARTALVGMSETDVRMCAGFPSRTVDIESGQIWTYERTINRGGVSLALPRVDLGVLPVPGGSVTVAPGGYCNMQVRFSGGRVAQVEYAGDNDLPRRRNALCEPIIDECVIYANASSPARERKQAQPAAAP